MKVNAELSFRALCKDPILFLAFGFGSGLAKWAPGTFGTLAAVPVYLFFSATDYIVYLLLTLLVCVVGVFICSDASSKLGVHDHSGIVWDEIAGLLLTMAFVPFSWTALFVGFVLFRFFDIVKPWPISWLDKNIHGGLGIMLDDLLAALFAGGILLLLG